MNRGNCTKLNYSKVSNVFANHGIKTDNFSKSAFKTECLQTNGNTYYLEQYKDDSSMEDNFIYGASLYLLTIEGKQLIYFFNNPEWYFRFNLGIANNINYKDDKTEEFMELIHNIVKTQKSN